MMWKRKLSEDWLDEGIRLDGRRMNEIRPIWLKLTSASPHGSAILPVVKLSH